MYLAQAQKHCDRTDQEVCWILQEWENILNDLEVDFMRCVDRIDWVAKKYLLNTFQESERLNWTDPWLQSIDLEYHNIALGTGALLRISPAKSNPAHPERGRDKDGYLYATGNDPSVFSRTVRRPIQCSDPHDPLGRGCFRPGFRPASCFFQPRL